MRPTTNFQHPCLRLSYSGCDQKQKKYLAKKDHPLLGQMFFYDGAPLRKQACNPRNYASIKTKDTRQEETRLESAKC